MVGGGGGDSHWEESKYAHWVCFVCFCVVFFSLFNKQPCYFVITYVKDGMNFLKS